MANSDGGFPFFFRFSYSTSYTFHVHTRGLRAVTSSGAGDAGTVVRWDDVEAATDDVIETYITNWLSYQPVSTSVLDYILYRVPSPGQAPEPLFASNVTGTGALGDLTGRAAGVQHMLTFRTSTFGLMKVVSLDRASGNTFGKRNTLSAAETGFRNYILSGAHAIMSAGNGRPISLHALNITLNDRLMRSYGKVVQ